MEGEREVWKEITRDNFCPCSPRPMYHRRDGTVWSSLGPVELFLNFSKTGDACVSRPDPPLGRNIEIFTV